MKCERCPDYDADVLAFVTYFGILLWLCERCCLRYQTNFGRVTVEKKL